MEESAYLALFERETTHWYPTTRRKIVRAVARSCIKGSDLRVLEIGSGTGGNVGLLREFGSLTCVEISATARQLTTQRIGDDLDLRGGAWPGEPGLVDGESFDLIAMLDVLEHLENDVDSLIAVRERLTPNGSLVLTVPAYQWMWSAHDTSLHHFRRYTRRSLLAVLSQAGLKPTRLTYFNTILFPAAALARLTFRALRIEKSPGQKLQKSWINSMFRWIFEREVRWVRSRSQPFGLSIIVVAKALGSTDR